MRTIEISVMVRIGRPIFVSAKPNSVPGQRLSKTMMDSPRMSQMSPRQMHMHMQM